MSTVTDTTTSAARRDDGCRGIRPAPPLRTTARDRAPRQRPLVRAARELAAREAAALAAHLGRARREAAAAHPQRGEVGRDRRRLAEPGALELLRRHLPAAVERLPPLLREPERDRDPRPAGVREPRRTCPRCPTSSWCSAAAATSRASSTRSSPSGAKTIWVQLGIWNQDAAYYGEEQGLTVVMDRCIKVEHARFHGGLHLLGFDTGQITARKTIR